MESKIVFFDFCETLVKFQTADAFINFVRQKAENNKIKKIEFIHQFLIKTRFFAICNLLFPKFSIEKKFKLYQLNGFEKAEIEKFAFEFYHEKVRRNFINDTLSKLIEYQENNYKIIVVSGGYSIYLKYFLEEFKINNLFATNIEFKENKCTGYIEGLDCLFENKIKILENNQFVTSNYSIAYSDSIADLPLLKWVKKGFVVSKNKSQSWAVLNNLEEIIWIDEKAN